MDTPFTPILTLLTVAESYLQNLPDPETDQSSFVDTFVVLILMEAVIDKQRSLVHGGSIDHPDQKSEVEQRLNDLRDGVAHMVQSLGNDKASEILRPLGSAISSNFIH